MHRSHHHLPTPFHLAGTSIDFVTHNFYLSEPAILYSKMILLLYVHIDHGRSMHSLVGDNHVSSTLISLFESGSLISCNEKTGDNVELDGDGVDGNGSLSI